MARSTAEIEQVFGIYFLHKIHSLGLVTCITSGTLAIYDYNDPTAVDQETRLQAYKTSEEVLSNLGESNGMKQLKLGIPMVRLPYCVWNRNSLVHRSISLPKLRSQLLNPLEESCKRCRK